MFDGKINLVIGECKTSSPITDDDMNNLKAVAKAFPTERFNVYVVLSKLEEFSAKEIESAKRLNDAYERRAILLSTADLEPYHPYQRGTDGPNNRRSVVSFQDMADATVSLFFASQTPVDLVCRPEPSIGGNLLL